MLHTCLLCKFQLLKILKFPLQPRNIKQENPPEALGKFNVFCILKTTSSTRRLLCNSEVLSLSIFLLRSREDNLKGR